MSQRPSISIIIPAYNTEKYLDKCITSVCRQTFEDLEVIIINDGSTDQTGNIADDWAQRDSRVRVVHTPNGGVAEARNIGLRHAQGRYIGFVDSDDWVEPEMFEKLVEAAQQDAADIAICGHVRETDDGVLMRLRQPVKESAVWTGHQALVKLLLDYKIRAYLWDKLYKKELFKGLTFPEGRLFEDQQVLHKVFEKASKVSYISQPLYHYVQRGGSILGAKNLTTDVEYLRSQLNLFLYVEDSDLFSKAERLVLRSYFGSNLLGAFRDLQKKPSQEARQEEAKLLSNFKTGGFYHYQKYSMFYKVIFLFMKKWGRRVM